MAQTATITGALNYPADEGATPSAVSLALSLVYSQKLSAQLEYDTPVTDQAVNLGTLSTGGAKITLLKCTLGSCTVKINGSDAIPLAAGMGYILLANTQQGILSTLTVTTTIPAILKIDAYA